MEKERNLNNSIESNSTNKVAFKSFEELQDKGGDIVAPFACTTLIVKDTNNNVYHGRGMELTFGEKLRLLR